jgi:hypothetical protein
MPGDTNIAEVELDHEDGLIVTFSNGTVGAFEAEELLKLLFENNSKSRREKRLKRNKKVSKTEQTTFPVMPTLSGLLKV